MDDFGWWVAALERRHLAELEFREVARSLRSLSATYVEHRGRVYRGAALTGAGKRAAFALFYAPLHYLLVTEIVKALDAWRRLPSTLVDLGCGTGAAGVAWARLASPAPSVTGIDIHPWALAEASETYRCFKVAARISRGNLTTVAWPKAPAAFIAAFSVNELPEARRTALLGRLLDRLQSSAPAERAAAATAVLIVEPIGGAGTAWWGTWRRAFAAAGGRADEWRFRVELPPIVAKLGRAAGLDHRELTGRSLWLSA